MSESFNRPAHPTGGTNVYDSYALYEIEGDTRNLLHSVVHALSYGGDVNNGDLSLLQCDLGYHSFVIRPDSIGQPTRHHPLVFHIPNGDTDRYFVLSPLGIDDDQTHFVPENGNRLMNEEREKIINWIQLDGGIGTHFRLQKRGDDFRPSDWSSIPR